jgi:hypothetical protein
VHANLEQLKDVDQIMQQLLAELNSLQNVNIKQEKFKRNMQENITKRKLSRLLVKLELLTDVDHPQPTDQLFAEQNLLQNVNIKQEKLKRNMQRNITKRRL